MNNYTEEDVEAIKTIDSRYCILGFERGVSGTDHIQGFIYFKNPRSFSSTMGLLPRAHIEIAKGTPQQNREYCSKSGNFVELGEMPVSSAQKGEKEIQRWTDAKRACQENKIEEVPDDIFIRYYRTLKDIRKDYMKKPEDIDDVCGVWLYGPPGSGKSYGARQRYEGAYDKPCNKWWDGYQGEEYVIIDDFDLNHSVLGHHLKIWADRYAFIAETKGGAVPIRPKKIIVTSNYAIDVIFKDRALIEALQRRFEEEYVTGF